MDNDSNHSMGREVVTKGAKIVGVVSCLPSKKIDNDYFVDTFGTKIVDDVVKMIGVQTRYWTDQTTTTKDLCLKASETLLKKLNWDSKTVDAIIFVSQTPEYRLPATACVIQDNLKLSTSTIAFDINLGCSGYPYALWLAMTMVQTGAAKRVLLAVGDTVSKIIDPNDRATAMLFGDAGTVTAIEACSDAEAFFIMGTDGAGANNLIVPCGGFKDYSLKKDPRLEDKNVSSLYMDGGEIFNFTLKAVPALIYKMLDFSKIDIINYDAFLFHQANMFMLKHLIKKAKIPSEKSPINIDEYGNTSCASIPLLMTTKLNETLKTKSLNLAMFGFGVGYSWASASLKVGPLTCVETVQL